MPTIGIRTSASAVSPIPVPDMGFSVPNGGVPTKVTFTDTETLLDASKSSDLITLTSDNGFGAGDHSLVLDDGSSDVASGDVTNFLRLLALPQSGPYSVVVTDGDGAGPAKQSVTVAAAQSPYTVLAADEVINCDCTAGQVQLNMPAAATWASKSKLIKKVDAGANTVLIEPFGSETLDKTANKTMQDPYASVEVYSDGTELWIQG